MKGISTILAMILIVIIVVALIGLTYTFAVGLFGTATTGATGQTEAVTKRLDQSIGFVTSPTCNDISAGTDNIWEMKFTIKHTGATHSIESTEIDALVGNEKFVISGFGTSMIPGETKYLTIENNETDTGISWNGTQTLTVSVPATPVSRTVICPDLP